MATLPRSHFHQTININQTNMVPGSYSLVHDNCTPSHRELMRTQCQILTAVNAAFPPSIHKFSILARVAVLDKATVFTRFTPQTRDKLCNFLLQGSQQTHTRPQQPLLEMLAELDAIATRAVIRALQQPPPPPRVPAPDPFELLQCVDPVPQTPPCHSATRHAPSPIGHKLPPPADHDDASVDECRRLDVGDAHGVKELFDVFGAAELRLQHS